MLFQLPPQFEPERDRLATFLRMLRPRYRQAFEFRHPVWYEVRIIGLLDNTAFPCASPATFMCADTGTKRSVKDNYAEGTLRIWAKRIRAWRLQGRSLFVFFDNDQKSAKSRRFGSEHRLSTAAREPRISPSG